MTFHRRELNTGSLLELSDQVSRIATKLASLSTNPEFSSSNSGQAGATEISAEAVGVILRARRLRAHYFDQELFADPAWDMLLDLFQAELAHRRVPVSSLCIAAAVPATTALRWMKTMAEKGLIVRHSDPFDGRRVYVELAPDTSRALRCYFAEVVGVPTV